MPSVPTQISVEVAYAEPQCAMVKILRLTVPATVADVLRSAAADPDFAQIDIAHAVVGVFGKIVRTDQILEDHDRVEIYRPLAADPKSARRARAGERRRKNQEPRASRCGRS